MSDHQLTSKTVELWIRSFAPVTTGPTQERALERVEALESAAPIDEIEISVWGKQVERTSRSRRIPQLRTIEARLDAFERWANRTGRSLVPFFRTRTVESSITGDRYEVCRLPTIALAEFADGELVHVAPCRDGDRTIEVFDRLDALERDEATDPVVTYEETHASDESISDQTRSGPDRRSLFVGPSPPGPN
ncbi:HTH domain-containing protein [Halosolutus amylolyticus]|uniref:HTH domain-containing protein n=1 Tax=Halosolutus amylolyticus TaxID=2932267 RepID=A0ABD5PRC3_9EURY|nr:HTH domain-containing protein [Halosolutus amylolyticus]